MIVHLRSDGVNDVQRHSPQVRLQLDPRNGPNDGLLHCGRRQRLRNQWIDDGPANPHPLRRALVIVAEVDEVLFRGPRDWYRSRGWPLVTAGTGAAVDCRGMTNGGAMLQVW